MIKVILKPIAFIFIIFLIVGNYTAPAEVTRSNVQVDGALGVLYNIGKFIVTPFKAVYYRYQIEKGETVISMEVGTEKSKIYTPDDYIEDYFEFQGKLSKYYKPLSQPKIGIKPNFTLKKIEHGQEGADMWYSFTAKDLVDDLQSKPVQEVFKAILDAMYGQYDKKIINEYVKKDYWCGRGVCDFDGVGAFKRIKSLEELNLPPTPEILREYTFINLFYFVKGRDGNDPTLPSKAILGKPIDCDGYVLYHYAMIYNINRLLGIKAEYYQVDVYPSGSGNGHSELFVYYPETGTWEIYSYFVSASYFYKYRGGVNVEAYRKLIKAKKIHAFEYGHGYPSNGDLPTSQYAVTFRDVGISMLSEVYVPAGKIQFNSFEEALYWYLSHQKLYHTDKFWFEVWKLPTPDDPYLYYVKNWSDRVISISELKQILVERGLYREINVYINKGRAPEKLGDPSWVVND
ncbi:hypothetical protein [Thermococcus piezophilus]|uniref:Uncharacterized protein n=1 Tax=Thermococcus piezophilus TaxID=1712654 RepID=A0A172WFA9_9EURY|nr:hypothetical protein [Thermococcus piezophilus]ANF22091.1 hypothetical protein A7C91_01970 [Thermococcus piezophilus]